MSRVHYGKKSRNSGRLLAEKLQEAGYNGPDINYGLGHSPEALNKPEALRMAVNKKNALMIMRDGDIKPPIPFLFIGEPNEAVLREYPVLVGRPDQHSKGRGFWLCRTMEDVQRALRGTRIKAAATHFMEYIEDAREFRVHVFRDKRQCVEHSEICYADSCNKYRTIKISEKIREVDVTSPQNNLPIPANHANGTVFNYTDINSRDRKALRKSARQAVKALALDFGAVDILLKDGKALVLEVNTAPRLTDETSDTLEKYVAAFMRYWSNDD